MPRGRRTLTGDIGELILQQILITNTSELILIWDAAGQEDIDL
jgi:hypothetical protein